MNKDFAPKVISDDQLGDVSGGKQMTSLKIVRDSGYADRLRAYDVMLDGKRVDNIKDGETRELTVSPGQHTLTLGLDWCGSEPVPFTVEEGQSIHFEAKSNIRGVRAPLAFWFVFFARNSYLRLTKIG